MNVQPPQDLLAEHLAGPRNEGRIAACGLRGRGIAQEKVARTLRVPPPHLLTMAVSAMQSAFAQFEGRRTA